MRTNRADPPSEGWSLVAALVLLANLDSDDRWYKLLMLAGPAAEAA